MLDDRHPGDFKRCFFPIGKTAGFLLLWWCVGVLFFSSAKAQEIYFDSSESKLDYRSVSDPRTVLQDTQCRKILLISTLSYVNDWSKNVVTEILQHFSDGPIRCVFDYVELNAANTSPAEYTARFQPYLERLKQGKYDIVVPILGDAGDLLLQHYQELPPNLPILFCRFVEIPLSLQEEYPNVVGVGNVDRIADNIDLALRLRPYIREIVIIVDGMPEGVALSRNLNQELSKDDRIHVRFINGENYTTQEMLQSVSALSRESLVILTPWRQYPDSGFQSQKAVAREVVRRTENPVIVLTPQLLDTGTLGGRISTGVQHGKEICRLMEAIFRGADVRTLKTQNLIPHYEIDWQTAQRFHLNMSLFPQDVIWRNRDIPFYQRYETELTWGILGGVGFLVILLSVILLGLHYRKNTALAISVFKELPVRIVIIGERDKILFCRSEQNHPCFNNAGKYARLKDLPIQDISPFREAIALTRETGHANIIKYQDKQETRLACFSLLSEKLYNQRAVMWVSHSIEDLEQEKARLEELAEWNRLTLNSIGDGLITVDVESRITFLNPVAEKMTGVLLQDAIGQEFTKVFQPFSAEEKQLPLRSIAEQAMQSGKAVRNHVNAILISKSFRRYHISGHAAPIRNKKGTLVGCVVVFRDITQEHEQQQKLDNLIENEQIINGCLQRIVSTSDFKSAVSNMMQVIGQNADADRSYIYRYFPEKNTVSCIFEWTRTGITPQIEQQQNIPMSFFPFWREYLEKGRDIVIPDTANPPAIFQEVKQTLQEQHVGSIAVTPLMNEGQMYGFSGLDFVRQKRVFSDSDMRMLHAISKLYHLTDQRQKESLKLMENFLLQRQVFDGIQLPLLLLDTHKHLQLVNAAFCEMTGKQKEEILGECCENGFCEFFQTKYCAKDNCPVLRILATEKPCEVVVAYRNGHTYQVVAQPLRDSAGVMTHILECIIDVTELSDSKARSEAALQEVREASRAKNCFLGTMSHELRTPLNTMIGFSELLSNEELPQETRRRYLAAIRNSGEILLKLLNDILDLSRIEAGQLLISIQCCDLSELQTHLEELFRWKIEQKHLEFRKSDCTALPICFLDRRRLRQILLNLLGNAIQFTEHGYLELQMSFTKLDKDKGDLQMSVSDTGIGIAPEIQPHIFEPFFYGDGDTPHNGICGAGIGLALVSRLVKGMNGSITLESTLGAGSRFILNFHDVPYQCHSHKKALLEPSPSTMPKLRLLLVDDVAVNLEVLKALSEKLQCHCVCARSGAEVLDILKRDPDFDWILTDLWMPEMTGEALRNIIRSHREWNSIKIAAITADVDGENTFNLTLFDGVLLKPLTSGSLSAFLFQDESDG